MLRTRLLTATAAVALFAAGSAFAQDVPAQPMPAPTPAPVTAPEAAAQATPAQAGTIIDVLRANGQFTMLLTALEATQLTETLTTQPAISIFAPNDAAFAALSEADRTRLLDPANVNELRQVLLYHVVVADVNSSQIEGTKGGVQTAANTEVQLDGTGSAIKVDAATVTTADIDAGNGAIFIIDRVLNPGDSLVASGDAEEAASAAEDVAAPPADTVTPPVADEAVDEATPPADSATADAMDADSAADEGAVAPPPTAPAASTPPTAPVTSPSTTTVTSPIVPNPTDGQVDGDDETPDQTPAPRPQA